MLKKENNYNNTDNWIVIPNEKYSKIYSKLRLLYDIEQEGRKKILKEIENQKSKKLSRIITNEKNPFDNITLNSKELYLYDFLLYYSDINPQENLNNPIENLFYDEKDNNLNINSYDPAVCIKYENLTQKKEANKLNLFSLYEISLKFTELLNKKKNIFISYSITDKTNLYSFKSLNIIGLNVTPNPLSYKHYKNIIKEISEVSVNTEKLSIDEEIKESNSCELINNQDTKSFFSNNNLNENNENYTSLVTIKLRMKSLFDYIEINSYEVYITDEDNELNWFGVKKYKIKEDNVNKFHEFYFQFSTDKKGKINVNRININIIPAVNTDKVVNINNIPHPIIIEL